MDAASVLSAEAFDRIRRAAAAATAAGSLDPSAAPTLSASEFSALDRRVRDLISPRAEELTEKPGGLRSAIALTNLAARSIWRRERIAADQYEAFVGLFRAEGVEVGPGDGSRRLRR
ncbi:hypothetical protein [Agromyces sp. Marseille-Q5079]|uniref:hypothetical protein n=1 Tax=Agromyces sp. Marseille-Q5079 TaxID=3439059 RepID=UPI003D9C9363